MATLLWSLFATFITLSGSLARAESPYLSQCNSSALDWYTNHVGETPCRTYSNLRQICNPQYEFSGLQLTIPGDTCNDQMSLCCCNSIAWALSMLCYNCQYNNNPTGNGYDAPTGSYYKYSHTGECASPLNGTIDSQVQTAVCQTQLDLPSWLYTLNWTDKGAWFYVYSSQQATLDFNSGMSQNFSNCKQESGLLSTTSLPVIPAQTITTSSSIVFITTTTSTVIMTTTSVTHTNLIIRHGNINAVAGGISGAFVALGLIAGVPLFLLWRRRQKREKNSAADNLEGTQLHDTSSILSTSSDRLLMQSSTIAPNRKANQTNIVQSPCPPTSSDDRRGNNRLDLTQEFSDVPVRLVRHANLAVPSSIIDPAHSMPPREDREIHRQAAYARLTHPASHITWTIFPRAPGPLCEKYYRKTIPWIFHAVPVFIFTKNTVMDLFVCLYLCRSS